VKNHQIFCSACDRPVRVLITEPSTESGQASIHDTEVVCLEIGNRCNGNMCPVSGVEPSAMVARLIRNGLPIASLETVRASCPACDAETEIVLFGDGKAVCSICGTPARWVVDHLEAPGT